MRADKLSIFTIGVYGRTADDFIAALLKNKVDLLVDVRRRRGLRGATYAWANSQRLQDLLSANRIDYLHALEWSPPEEMIAKQHAFDKQEFGAVRQREKLRPEFVTDYKEVMKVHPAKELLALIAEQFPKAKRPCLLCVEAEAQLCHRLLLADAMAKYNKSVVKHL